MMKNDSALFFTCSLIEYIGRQQKRTRRDVVSALGRETLKRIYRYADVLHCEPIERAAEEFITMREIQTGAFDNVGSCKYTIPDYWTIGEVYERLIEDTAGDDMIMTLEEVYSSWISDSISDFNSDFFYQSREYIAACYCEGKIL